MGAVGLPKGGPLVKKYEMKAFEQVDWVVVSNIFYFHLYLGKIPILTNIFQMGGSTTNQLKMMVMSFINPMFLKILMKVVTVLFLQRSLQLAASFQLLMLGAATEKKSFPNRS